MATGRAGDSRRGVTLDDGQQQTVQERLRQHASVRACVGDFDVDAEASLANDNTPKIAATAIREHRR
jgi:hypothetical protein